MGTGRLIGRQKPGFRLDFMEIFGDRQGIPDLDPMVGQAGHQKRRRKQ